jgi:hypothetical protein
MKIFRMLGLSFLLMLAMSIPVHANTIVEKTNTIDFFATNGEYSVFVVDLGDPDTLFLVVVNDATSEIRNMIISRSYLAVGNKVAVLKVPDDPSTVLDDSINLTWNYKKVDKNSESGKIFVKNQTDFDTGEILKRVINSYSFTNNATASGTLFGNPYNSTSAGTFTNSNHIIK